MTDSTNTGDRVDEAPVEKTERGDKLRKAYGAATKALREAHRQEFDSLYAAEAQKLGEVYVPPLTKAQKAEQQIADLLAEHPDLATKFSQPSA